ncbi:MgtC/SapB family protein [Carboxylicivirga sp. A043]|uniref:MgtC/SapB family protein n=1 Tax=Carboxylicivirga litoralis TaxID=2816963 RepID=UPI0021CAEBD4|nr:MgtC/SapB family protein [Carboxylicivirga sp. A043]MCU4158156.1 MgtC/SapB family protein [Carboxylicivirga sp. A043]
MSDVDFILRLLCSLVAGLLIGFERGWHHKAAGLRTITLVTVGSALYVMLSIKMTLLEGDVTRIIAQVVTGIGFLGAGIIFKEGNIARGLTTAATVWCSSAIGCMAAAGFYTETLLVALAVLLVNSVLIIVDKHLEKRDADKEDSCD